MLQENHCLGAYTKLSFVTILVPVLISIVITQFILSLGLSILTTSLQLPIARTRKLSFCSYPVTLCDYTASPSSPLCKPTSAIPLWPGFGGLTTLISFLAFTVCLVITLTSQGIL